MPSQKMKILYVESGVNGGGSFESLLQHIKAVDRNHFEPHVVFLNRTKYVQQFRDMEVPTHVIEDPVFTRAGNSSLQPMRHILWRGVRNYCPWFYGFTVRCLQSSTIENLTNLIDQFEIDIIHLNDQPDRDWFGVEAAKRTGISCVSHIRTGNVPNIEAMGKSFLNQHVNRFLANSRFVADCWSERGLEDQLIEVVYNAVQTESVEPADLSEIGVNPDSFVLVNASRPSPIKGLDYLLRSLARYRDRYGSEDLSLLLVGWRAGDKNVHEALEDHGLSDMVTLTDWVEDAKPYIAASDAMVVTSKMEGFGRVLLEAMMVETPVVATDVGGVSEVLRGDAGLLVEYGNTEEWVETVHRLRNDPELREKLIRNGRGQLQENFSRETYAETVERFYTELI